MGGLTTVTNTACSRRENLPVLNPQNAVYGIGIDCFLGQVQQLWRNPAQQAVASIHLSVEKVKPSIPAGNIEYQKSRGTLPPTTRSSQCNRHRTGGDARRRGRR